MLFPIISIKIINYMLLSVLIPDRIFKKKEKKYFEKVFEKLKL